MKKKILFDLHTPREPSMDGVEDDIMLRFSILYFIQKCLHGLCNNVYEIYDYDSKIYICQSSQIKNSAIILHTAILLSGIHF